MRSGRFAPGSRRAVPGRAGTAEPAYVRPPGTPSSRADPGGTRDVVDERHVAARRQRLPAGVRELKGPQQYRVSRRGGRHADGNRPGRRRGRDRPGDRLAEELEPGPFPRVGDDPPAVHDPPVRRRPPPLVLVQVREPGHLVGGRVEVHPVVGERRAGLLIGEQPPPLQRPRHVDRPQEQPHPPSRHPSRHQVPNRYKPPSATRIGLLTLPPQPRQERQIQRKVTPQEAGFGEPPNIVKWFAEGLSRRIQDETPAEPARFAQRAPGGR
jgi:hypothetical protein